MTFSQFRNNKVVRFLSNRYVLILLVFAVWMLFFDTNSYLNHRELDKEIDKLEKANSYYKKEMEHDKKIIKNLQNPDSLERFAREEYKMKRKDEDIYIIDFDSTK
ncbi:MAG: septum formation initiator family protein [Flavobacteriaceae bacterium]|nr:septum formation initiator family protein [Flavobacteriaceae bacterium]MCB0475925.1 septum formation initiator family protein [Flavobacteriaceae bacterium]